MSNMICKSLPCTKLQINSCQPSKINTTKYVIFFEKADIRPSTGIHLQANQSKTNNRFHFKMLQKYQSMAKNSRKVFIMRLQRFRLVKTLFKAVNIRVCLSLYLTSFRTYHCYSHCWSRKMKSQKSYQMHFLQIGLLQ